MIMNNFEAYLFSSLDSYKDNKIKEAMKYCLEGGKRFRPNIMFSIVKGYGINEEVAYGAACALEYIQTYSLIHDDLPGMDNDDYRRGKLSCHKKFGEAIGILTGDALLTHAFSKICEADYRSDIKVNLISCLAKYAGLDGMIYGQLLDVQSEASDNISKDLLFEIEDNKTSGLFKFACLAAMYIGSDNNYEYFETLGSKIGIIFQNQDDLFDIIKTEEETGKSNSDLRNDKLTALSYKSVDELKEYIDYLFDDLYKYLEGANFDTKYIIEIIDRMKNR